MEDTECRDFIVHDDVSVIDYDVSEVDAKNIADGCIDDWRDAAADAEGWSEEVENTFVALVTHRSVMINDRDATEEDYVGPDCTRVCDYELQPTAEWSRIQQALKERDEIAAELERVKAERNAYRLCLIESGAIYEDTPPMDKFAAEVIGGAIKIEHEKLSSLKSRLPVNADGDVPDIGDDIWEWYEGHKCPGKNSLKKLLKDKDGWCYIDMYGIRRRPQDFHSTAESCRAANESNEGESDGE